MIFNAGMSTLALNRYNQRQQGNLQKTPQMTAAVEDSRTDLEKFLDKHFPDKRMEQIYPNAKTVVDGKPVSYTHLDVYKRQVWSHCLQRFLHSADR